MRAAGARLLGAVDIFRDLATADPLTVETHTAELLARLSEEAGSALDVVMAVLSLANQRPDPPVAALTAAINYFLPGMATNMALADLARAGVRPPAWHGRLGEVTPGRAWRYPDVFDDRAALVVTFSYGDAEHAILVELLACPDPRIEAVRLSADVDELRGHAERELGGPRVAEEVTLAGAAAVLRAGLRARNRGPRRDDLVFLPVMLRRVERLPGPEQAEGDGFPDADRQAAVAAFVTETAGTAEVDEDVLRFWAGVLAGATAPSGSAPTRIGPEWFSYVLGEYVPRTFELTQPQRAGLLPAVTAWSRWAGRRQDLPEAAVDQVVARVAEIEQGFDPVYGDPAVAATRCYVSDATADPVDGVRLARLFAVRSHAVPLPAYRPEAVRLLDASDPGQRRRILAGELDTWGVDEDGIQEWQSALESVSDQLWRGDPPELAEAVARFLALEGPDPDLLGDLTESAVAHTGDRDGFLKAAYARVEPLDEL